MTTLRKRAGTLARVAIGGGIVFGLAGAVPTASWVYAQLGGFQFTLWVWIAGLVHGLRPDELYLAGLAGLLEASLLPAVVAWAVLPPKPLHGEARLARPGEVRRAGLYRATGYSIVLGRDERGWLLIFDGDLHAFLAAATGTGKGVGFVVPNLLYWLGSVICLDIKGENYTKTSGQRARLEQAIYRFDPLENEGRTHRFNPLDYISNGERRVNDVQTLAWNLIPPATGNKESYWDDTARDLLTGLVLLVVEAGSALGWPVSIGQINRLVRSEEDTAEYLQGILKDCETRGIEVSGICRSYILSWCAEPEKPRGSIKSTLATKLSLWSSPLVDRATETSDFDLRDFRKKPMSLYLSVSPDDLKKLAPLIKVLIDTFLSENTKAGETPDAVPELQTPVLLLLDEFLSLGLMPKVIDALAYVRGWGIRVLTVIQSEAQLQALYGRELTEAYVDNHRARVYYKPPTHRRDLAEHIAKMIGQATVRQRSYSYGRGGRSRQVSETGQYVISPDEIATLSEDETIVLVDGLRPLRGRKLRYYKDKLFRRRQLPALPLPPSLRTRAVDHVEREAEQVRAALDELIPAAGELTSDMLKHIAEGLMSVASSASSEAMRRLTVMTEQAVS